MKLSIDKNTAVAVEIAIAVILTTILAHWFFTPAVAGPGTFEDPDLGRPKFTNPCEIYYREGEKKLRGVIEIVSGKFLIPNQRAEPLRQFRNGDKAHPCPSPSPGATGVPPVSPGPTLRARLGDQVQIAFLNKALSRERDTTKIFFPFSPDVFGCDKSGTENGSGTIFPYPSNDKFPNCFHGTATANIHFHGTHISPDGLGDNVLVQILADADQQDWTTIFTQLFDSGKIPEKWLDMPPDYVEKQMELIKKFDERLFDENQRRINAGEWPQYLMGAFPNFFKIPEDGSDNQAGQAPGTHWYHAHKHGSTSLHIQNGLAGALIIESNKEGGYDHFIRKSLGWTTYEGHEKIFIFQQYDSTQHLMRDPAPSDPSARPSARPVLVNGMSAPLITMRPGEIQLWRLINATEGNTKGIISAGNSATGLFQTQGFTFRQTAQDGVQFNKDNYLNQPFLKPRTDGGVPGGITLAAGNRVDLLVQAPATAGRQEFKNKNGDLLFVVKVEGTQMPSDTPPMPATWTEDWVGFLKDLPAPSPKENPNLVQFQWEVGRKSAPRDPVTKFPPHFMINGKQFGEYGEVVDQCMPEDALQDWVIENYTTMAHPFHIHINPFQVIQIDTPAKNTDSTKSPVYDTYAPTKSFVWQDVVNIPAGVPSPDGKTISPGRVRIRHRFVDFPGTFVLHCHILAHEDRGMMQLVRVVPAKDYPKGCQIRIPEHH